MTANLLSLNCSKTEFLLIGLQQQLTKIHDSSLSTTHCARNLGFIFDEHLTFSDQISAFSKSSYYRMRRLRCIRLYLDFKTVSTIATSIVHSKLDYCEGLSRDWSTLQSAYCRSGEEQSHKSPTPGGGPDEYRRAVSLFSFILRTRLAYDVSTNLELAS